MQICNKDTYHLVLGLYAGITFPTCSLVLFLRCTLNVVGPLIHTDFHCEMKKGHAASDHRLGDCRTGQAHMMCQAHLLVFSFRRLLLGRATSVFSEGSLYGCVRRWVCVSSFS